jgi:hypothetical protein
MKGVPKLPAVHRNLLDAFAECTFTYLVDGGVWGEGFVVGAFTKDGLDVTYRHAGAKEEYETVLPISGLHYDGATPTGFHFSPRTH